MTTALRGKGRARGVWKPWDARAWNGFVIWKSLDLDHLLFRCLGRIENVRFVVVLVKAFSNTAIKTIELPYGIISNHIKSYHIISYRTSISVVGHVFICLQTARREATAVLKRRDTRIEAHTLDRPCHRVCTRPGSLSTKTRNNEARDIDPPLVIIGVSRTVCGCTSRADIDDDRGGAPIMSKSMPMEGSCRCLSEKRKLRFP